MAAAIRRLIIASRFVLVVNVGLFVPQSAYAAIALSRSLLRKAAFHAQVLLPQVVLIFTAD